MQELSNNKDVERVLGVFEAVLDGHYTVSHLASHCKGREIGQDTQFFRILPHTSDVDELAILVFSINSILEVLWSE